MTFILISGVLLISFIIYQLLKRRRPANIPSEEIIKNTLKQRVAFYQKLTGNEQKEFGQRVLSFLKTVNIQGVDTAIEESDKVLVGAAGIIPIFAFKHWEYQNIREILLYSATFNEGYQTKGTGRNVLGMVGDGVMNRVMILSLPELRKGFSNKNDQSNTAIHEFVHLVDKDDGYADGLPQQLLSHGYAIPWLKRIHQEILLIQQGKSDINPYATTNEAEFLAVAAEYFFEQPELMEKKHPELYSMLQQVFHQRSV
jgi:Mlc titration factor MtfA (ptsG expression regulator)